MEQPGHGQSLLKRLKLPDFSKTKGQKPSERLSGLLDNELLKGICTNRPKVPEDKLMFQRKDINKTKNPLAKLFRLIMYKLRFTPDDYKSKAIAYGASIGKTGAEITTTLSNAKKAIYGENLTVMQLERNLIFADYEILDLSVTIQSKETGEITEYKLSDIAKLKGDDASDDPLDYLDIPDGDTDTEE